MYTKLDFCSELLTLIKNQADDSAISLWADEVRILNCNCSDCDEDVMKYVDDLGYIDEPGFEMPRENIVRMCVDILNKYYSETYSSKK